MTAPLATSAVQAETEASHVRGLRVLELCDYYGPGSMGGSERVAREVNRRLVDLGAELTVLTALDGVPFDDPAVRVMHRPARDLSRVLGAQLAVSPGYLGWATKLARAVQPDVIYTHSLHFQGSLVAACVSRRLGLPLVTVAHVGALDQLTGRARLLAEAHERTVGRFILASSWEVAAVSAPVAEHSRARGAAPEFVHVVPNGVDHQRFIPTPTPGGVPNVLFVGRLIDNKGPHLLLDAARRLWRSGVRLRLTFVGDGPMRGELEHAARGLGNNVRFVGHSHDVPSWMRLAHVVVRPSFTEGMPLTVLEAMASHRCVVVSDIPPHRELVDQLYTGLLHRAGDAGDLATQLGIVLEDRELRDRVADEAYRLSLEYSWDASASGHARVLARAARRVRALARSDGPKEAVGR